MWQWLTRQAGMHRRDKWADQTGWYVCVFPYGKPTKYSIARNDRKQKLQFTMIKLQEPFCYPPL